MHITKRSSSKPIVILLRNISMASWTMLKWNSFILPCFEQLVSIANISKWDPTVFRWSIAITTYWVLVFTPEQVLPEDMLNLLFILWDRWRRRPGWPWMWCPGCSYQSSPSLGWCSSQLGKINVEYWVDNQVVWKPGKVTCLATCEVLKLQRTQTP